METKQYNWGTGRRKTAVARVRIRVGSGAVVINNKTAEAYIGNRRTLQKMLREPFITINQAGAIRHGIARALVEMNPDLRPALKAQGLLTRDARVKERKKYGQKRARKKFQFSKR